jgi:hypothetical protein
VSDVVGSSELLPGGAVAAVVYCLELDPIVASDDPEFVVADQSVELGSAFEGVACGEFVEGRCE